MRRKNIRQQQLRVVHHRRNVQQQKKFEASPGRLVRSNSMTFGQRPICILRDDADYPANAGNICLPKTLKFNSDWNVTLNTGELKRIQKSISRKKKKKKNERIENPRDAGIDRLESEHNITHAASVVAKKARELNQDSKVKFAQLEDIRFKYLLARREIEADVSILKKEVEKLELKETPGIDDENDGGKKPQKHLEISSPGAFTIHVRKRLQRKILSTENVAAVNLPDATERRNTLFDKRQVDEMIAKCADCETMTEELLYDTRYDSAWNSKYNKKIGDGKKVPNKAGWVVPLKRLCDRIGIDSDFFVKNRKVGLDEARSFILYQRLTRAQEASTWLKNDEKNLVNEALNEFFENDWDGAGVQRRMALYNRNVESDRDRVRIQGRYYNNIVLGKHMFGPGRKQVFIRTMIGGMERRFEILDNQVNHITFTHEASDNNPELCRNRRVKCRDSTRVVLRFPPGHKNDFIHANYVKGGSLFNSFIVTQAPMNNTIGDFWRMIWQEKSPYIFMLISRKNPSRCASYWPRHLGDRLVRDGLAIINNGIDEFRSPLFRITYLTVIGPAGDDLNVEHWQGDMNNSDNVAIPLQLLRLSRNCSYPVTVHCHIGISRSATLVAAEICIASLLKGPSYKHCVQKSVQLLRSQRPYSIETPMQYIFVHRVVQHFIHNFVGDPLGFHLDYKRWIDERSVRPFIDDIEQPIPGYRQLSPRVDPDLVVLVRHRDRPDARRETHDCVGQLPIPLVSSLDKRCGELQLTRRYPRGSRYD